MNFAELFITLGLKDTGNTEKKLQATKGTLGEIKTSGLAAKAAIIGVFYAFERLTAKSNDLGLSLSQFAATTGDDVQVLQKWQYAGRQMGATAESVAGSLKSVKQAMQTMKFSGQQPDMYPLVNSLVGIDPERILEKQYMMEKLIEASKKVNPLQAMQIFKSFGVDDKTGAAALQGAFDPEKLAKAPAGLSLKQANILRDIGGKWETLWYRIEMSVAKLNMKHGGKLITDLTELADSSAKLIDALARLMEALQAFKGLSATMKMTAKLVGYEAENIADIATPRKPVPIEEINKKIQGMSWFDLMAQGISGSYRLQDRKPNSEKKSLEVKQTFNFHHDGKNAGDVGRSAHGGVKEAYDQYSEKIQAN